MLGTIVSTLVCPLPQAQAVAPEPLSLLRPTAPAAALRATATTPLTLSPETGVWNLSRYESLSLKLRNPGQEPVTVWARAENPEAKGSMDSCRTAMMLGPGKTETLRLRVMRRPQDPTYAPFKPFFMYFKAINVRDNTVDPAAIARVVVWLDPPRAGQSVFVESVTARGEGVAGSVSFLPFVDKYGQYIHTDWPDKIYSDADFAARRQKEEAEMSAYPGPADWDPWGGWKNGPRQKATGFFHPAKVEGKWWLVDPQGCLFWSYGPTGVGAGGDATPVTGKEPWFTQVPSPEGPFARCWSQGKNARYGYYQDKTYRSFDFSRANAQRKYGKDWREATADFLQRRLRNWGFNTIANWSDPAVFLRRKTPYVVAIHYGGPWREHIPDVFDPEFEKALRERMEAERGKTANDPWNLGYFVDNELAWGYRDKAEIAVQGILRAAAASVSKQTLVKDLKARHGGIAALNTAWGSNYASWDALLEARTLPEVKNPSARSEDLGAFGLKFAEKYFSTVRDAVKRVAPNNLYLGCRFHGHIDLPIVQLAAKYTDVISYNVYEEPGSRLNRYLGLVDRPFIVGEFGIGSDPGQTPFRGDVLSEDPLLRVHTLENWVRQAIAHPLIVGGHYFQFRDQPITGRGDGEATLRGLVNTADTPHFELVQANRRLGYRMYPMRGGVTNDVPIGVHAAAPAARDARSDTTPPLGWARIR